MRPIILDLCGGTGAWSDPYREAGYDVRLISLPDSDVRQYRPPLKVHGILAAPPCTMFSFARTRAKIPRNFDEGMEVVIACLSVIWEAKPVWWALENPVGYLRRFLGAPAMTFKPAEFGDESNKRTDLWGYFQPPKKLAIPVAVTKGCHRASRWHDWPGAGNRTVLRAITPPRFARAFFEANP